MRAANPRKIYQTLSKSFGPRGWWPVTVAGRRGPAYHPGSFPDFTEKNIFENKIEKYYLNSITERVKEYFNALDKNDK